jgi:hypothetical protein
VDRGIPSSAERFLVVFWGEREHNNNMEHQRCLCVTDEWADGQNFKVLSHLCVGDWRNSRTISGLGWVPNPEPVEYEIRLLVTTSRRSACVLAVECWSHRSALVCVTYTMISDLPYTYSEGCRIFSTCRGSFGKTWGLKLKVVYLYTC